MDGLQRHFHCIDTSSKPRMNVKAAKFVQPIVFAKRVVPTSGSTYQIAMFSFQSTGPTNIMTVNSIISGKAYIRTKVRGRGDCHFT